MSYNRLVLLLMSVLAVMLIFNQWQVVSLRTMLHPGEEVALAQEDKTGSGNAAVTQDMQAIAAQILPKGIPPVYGAELGVSFDNPAAAIPILARYEQDTRENKLTSAELERYIAIGSATSCEYCCGARTMVFPNGDKACGCAHSAAMRGVVAYLLDKHGDELTDRQILTEANKWKAVFFPGPTVEKYLASTGQSGSQGELQQQVGGC